MEKIVDQKVVEKIAKLSKLKLSEEETGIMVEQIEKFLEYVEQLKEVDENIEPLENITGRENVWREDVVVRSEVAEKIVSNSPKNREGFILVPKVLE